MVPQPLRAVNSAYDDLTAEASTAPAGSHGLFWLPYLMGERTPHLDANARGAWIGLTAKHGRAGTGPIPPRRRFVQPEGWPGNHRLVRRASFASAAVRRRRKERLLDPVVCRYLRTRVATLATQEGSAYGAALLALVGTGAYASAVEVCRAAIHEVSAKEPEPAGASAYQKRYAIYQSIYRGIEANVRRDQPAGCLSRIFCDVALPVPVDRLFTYSLPETLQHRVKPGCRLQVPFAGRTLTGVVARAHSSHPGSETREALKLLDEEPVLDAELLRLGHWIAEYYCAPIGEVLKSMLPLSGEVRRTEMYSLTPLGVDMARQFTIGESESAATKLLRLLENRPRSASYLNGKVPGAKRELRTLTKRGWVEVDTNETSRDPLRASAERLSVEFLRRPAPEIKLRKAEREVLAFLELHPGAHNLAKLNETLSNASETARALARRELVRLQIEQLRSTVLERPVPVLNAHQSAAFEAIQSALAARTFQTFLLQGVTGSGKTEVYLRCIEACLGGGRNALLLVPEIALTPAVAGQFFHRFGDQVAILHSAFGDSERAEQWRRIRRGQARVVVGTRSGIFAPVQDLGLVIIDEEHDGSYKQAETPRYHGRDVALVRAKEAGAVAVLGSATPSIESRYNADSGKYSLLRLPERIARRPLPKVDLIDMRCEFLETKKQATFSRQLIAEMRQRVAVGEQTMLLLNRRGFSSFMLCRECGERLQCANCSVVLTFHKRDRRMLCHYCGYAEKVPHLCPKCGSDYIQFLGTGSERVEEELHEHLPGARIARLDRDTATAERSFRNNPASVSRRGHRHPGRNTDDREGT